MTIYLCTSKIYKEINIFCAFFGDMNICLLKL